MPELPEVETVANGVHARVAGARVCGVWTSGRPQTFATDEHELAAAVAGARIAAVRRVGKSIVMDLELMAEPVDSPAAENAAASRPVPAQLLVHLGMTGRLLVSPAEVPRPPHTHLALELAGEPARELRFVDARRFGRLSLLRPQDGVPADAKPAKAWAGRIDAATGGFAGPGREPLTIGVEEFIALFRGSKKTGSRSVKTPGNRPVKAPSHRPVKAPIKAALLNQHLLHGVGNIYADESLYRAGIRPRRQAAGLSRAELTRLHAELQAVLRRAIELGGSSVSDYVDADGVRGFFQLEHAVYGRAGELCRRCETPLKKLSVGGRTTVYCPQCQR